MHSIYGGFQKGIAVSFFEIFFLEESTSPQDSLTSCFFIILLTTITRTKGPINLPQGFVRLVS